MKRFFYYKVHESVVIAALASTDCLLVNKRIFRVEQ